MRDQGVRANEVALGAQISARTTLRAGGSVCSQGDVLLILCFKL